MRVRPLTRALVAGVAASLAATACSIQPNDAPRNVPAAQRPQLAPAPEAGQAIGAGRVFLLAGSMGEQSLRTVPRDAETGQQIIQALIDGPNEGELDAGLQSAIPPELMLNTPPRAVGSTFTIDVSDQLLNLSSAQLRMAIAQLVFTAGEIDGVRDVRILVDGSTRAWPNGRGTLTSAPLDVYDFPGFAESSQPHFPVVPSPREAASATDG
ncbi:MAG: GerMN domain-containing protein [Desertimonas sp.]